MINHVALTVVDDNAIALSVSGEEGIGLTMSAEQLIVDPPYFDGPYEFTPSASAQTIAIEEKMGRSDIIINPIPNNYGLITWDGSTLTVS